MNHSLPTIPSTLTNEIFVRTLEKRWTRNAIQCHLDFRNRKENNPRQIVIQIFFFSISLSRYLYHVRVSLLLTWLLRNWIVIFFFYLFLQPYYQASIKLLIPSPPIVCTLSQHRLTCRDRSLASLLSRRSNNSRRQTDFTKSSTSSTPECTTRLHLFQNICFPPYQSNYQFLVILVIL